MMRKLILIFLFYNISTVTFSQQLRIKNRKSDALSGSSFFDIISDSSLTPAKREHLIFKQIKKGNVPNFLRALKMVTINDTINNTPYRLKIYVIADYLAIGNDTDYCYVPTTPMLAQKIANYTSTLLPTKKISDLIYQNASIKLTPQPIPPNNKMSTVPVFIQHNQMVQQQLSNFSRDSTSLIAGNKKDIIISNKIYGENTKRVVIYGWHQPNGNAIQPVYNKHTNLWVDYSHGVRLIAKEGLLNDEPVKLDDLLKDKGLARIISDEGPILKAFYPLK